MADEEADAQPIEEDSGPESGSDTDNEYEDGVGELGELGDLGDLSQELTVEDATDFAQDDPDEELCDYEMVDELDETLDQKSYLVNRSSSTIYTTEYLTKYEKARVLGWRAQHIKSRAAPMLAADEKDKSGRFIFKDGKYPTESYEIAKKELEFGRLPAIIGRRMPNGEKILVRVSNLKLI